MANRTDSQISGASAAVAISIVLLLGSVLVVSIIKYATVDDALKYSASLSAIVGVVTGALVSFFFTRGAAQTAQQAAETAQTVSRSATQAVQEAAASATEAMKQATQLTQDAATKAIQDSADVRLGNLAFRALVADLDPRTVQSMKKRIPVLSQALDKGPEIETGGRRG
jgi:mannitol-specific phosphotransferase system IIBC component